MSGETDVKVVDFMVTVTEAEYAALIKFVGTTLDPKDLNPDLYSFVQVEAVAGMFLSKAINLWLIEPMKGEPK